MRLLHVGIQADLGYTLLTHKYIGRVRRKLLCVVKVVVHPGKARKKKKKDRMNDYTLFEDGLLQK